MGWNTITDDDAAAFARDGYAVVRRLLNAEETDLLQRIARADEDLRRKAVDRLDAQGAGSRISLENALGDDVSSAIARSRRVVDAMERLLGGEVYHYHHKMTMKEPRVGGAWEWHQDYGYWYNNGCLRPLMASCMIAVDRCTRENGCLQVIPGSHELGRIDHGRAGDQTGADPERMAAILERKPVVHCEMDAGDAVFFHCNTLHRSDQNRSDAPRWTFICCYNAARNDPYKESGHPRYTPLAKLPDEELVAAARRHCERLGA